MSVLTNISGTTLTTVGGSELYSVLFDVPTHGPIPTRDIETRKEDLIQGTANSPKRYRFTLYNKAFGTLVLRHAPDGWAEDEFSMSRSMKYFGVFRKFSQSELKFIKEGRDYLQSCYEAFGVNADVIITVDYYSTQNVYSTRFEGTIDFSTWKVNELSAAVQIKDGGFQDLIFNRESVDVDVLKPTSVDGVSIGNPSVESIYIPEIAIKAYADFENGGKSKTGSHVVPVVLTWFNFTEAATQGTTLGSQDSGFFKNSTDDYVDFSIMGTFAFQLLPNKIYDFDIMIDRYHGGAYVDNVFTENISESSGSNGKRFIHQYNTVTDVALGDYLLLYIQDNIGTSIFNYEFVTLKIGDLVEFIPQSYAWGLTYREAFNRLIAHYTGQTDKVVSTVLGEANADNDINGVVLTALMLTGKFDTITFNLNLQNLFNSLSLYNIGIGIENGNFVVENMRYWFDDTVILDLSGRIDEALIEKSVIPELYANQINIGFNAYDYTKVGGVYDPNTNAIYTTPIKSIKSEFSVQSPFRADTAAIFDILKSYFEDNKYQPGNDIFLFETYFDDLTRKALTDQGFDYVSADTKLGVTMFNVNLSPARTLRRWGSFINAMLHNAGTRLLKWTTTENATSLVSKKTTESQAIIENADVNGSELEPNIWINEAYTCEVPLQEADIIAIQSNPKGIVKLSDTKYGWILEYKSKNENRKSNYKLLRVNLDVVTPSEFQQKGFGRIYNNYAASDYRNMANVGWRVATYDDYAYLIVYLGGDSVAGGKMKETGSDHWIIPNVDASNSSGFTAVGSGYRDYNGDFGGLSLESWLIHSDVIDIYHFAKRLYANSSAIEEISNGVAYGPKRCGGAIRLVKENPDSHSRYYVGNDGKIYPSVLIGTQEWTSINSKETKYRTTQIVRMGYLYNYYTVLDSRNIAPDGWHVPTYTEVLDLIALGGNALKEAGTTNWSYPNTGAYNSWGWNGRSSGVRLVGLGIDFESVMEIGTWWFESAEQVGYYILTYNTSTAQLDQGDYNYKEGRALRLVKDSTILSEGSTGVMTGNDGKRYHTIQIGGKEWLSENLCETKFRDGSLIPEVTDSEEWDALTTPARCSYGNDETIYAIPVVGDTIEQITDAGEWAAATGGAWCYYNNDSKNE